MRWAGAAIRVLMVGLAVIGLCDYLYGEMERKGIEDNDGMLVDSYIPAFSALLVIFIYYFICLITGRRIPKEHAKHVSWYGPMITCMSLGVVLGLVIVLILLMAEVQPQWLRFAFLAAIMVMSTVASTEWTFVDYTLRKERGEFG